MPNLPTGLSYAKCVCSHRVEVCTHCATKAFDWLCFNGFFFFFLFHRSNSALHRQSSIEILLDHWATFCRGASQCLFFVSGSSRIRTHVLVITMRTCYRCATLTPLKASAPS